jgi:hypothetical protein
MNMLREGLLLVAEMSSRSRKPLKVWGLGAATGCGDEFKVGETIEGFGEVKKRLLRLDEEIDKVLPRHNGRVLGGTAQRLHQRGAEKLLFCKRLNGQR